MSIAAVLAAVVTCSSLTWSRGSAADDVIVSTTWLYERLSSVIILEATYSLSDQQTSIEHIPGASLWDVRQCSWPTSTRPHNDPEELCLQVYARSVGVDKYTPIVVYDRSSHLPGAAAARTWWTLAVLYGRDDVFVLDGGWAEWTRRQLPTTGGRYQQFYRQHDARGDWVARYKSSHFRNLEQMTADIRTEQRQVVDTRLPEHYRGDDVPLSRVIVDALTAAEVTPCRRLQRGHMLTAVNVPWTSVVDRQSALLVDRRRLVDVFQTAGVDVGRPLTITAYVGDAACLVALAAVHCGAGDVAVYTGSWMEWAQLADRRLTVRGDGARALDGFCPIQWESSKTEFMDIVADVRESTVNCDERM